MKKNSNFKKVSMNRKTTDDWEVKKISNLFKVKTGDLILEKDLIKDGKIPVYSATKDNKIYGYVNQAKTILRKSLDIIVPSRGYSMGMAKIPDENATSTQSTTMLIAKQNNEEISRYVRAYLTANRKKFFRDTTGGAILQIKRKDIEDIPIKIPTDKNDIIQIVEILEKQEKMIELRKNQLLNEEKKLQVLQQDLLGGKICLKDIRKN